MVHDGARHRKRHWTTHVGREFSLRGLNTLFLHGILSPEGDDSPLAWIPDRFPRTSTLVGGLQG
jgi:hypothetical protein